MCGLTFLFDDSATNDTLSHRTLRALQKIIHRGPDDEQVKVIGNAALGHRRLSIIDLDASIQPMVDVSGRYFLVYNGEIYNYKEVRLSLEGKWTFQTNGDTEVLLAGLALYGEKFLSRLEGMWAFAFWDSAERELLLGRDRLGKKPLYYQTMSSGIACASELSALKALSEVSWTEDIDSTADFLRYGYSLPGFTAYNEVREVLPGHVATWSNGREIKQLPWWQLEVKSSTLNKQEAHTELRRRLIEAVERRMVADVEVGAFLSGGIDSSLICSIIRNELGLPLKTFTVGFTEEAYDEREFARHLAEKCNTEHYEEVMTSWNEKQLESLLLDNVGQPFADASILPTALVSEIAAKKVKVALSGDGGDELFSGYQRYQARNILIWYTRLPKPIQKLAEKAVRALPEPMVHHSRSIVKKAHLFMDIVERNKAETPYFAPFLIEPKFFNRLASDLVGKGHTPPNILEETRLDDIQRMMFADSLIYMPQDILRKVDRASMSHSLEVRAPFLDSKVVELAFSLPVKWHRRITGKQMLKKTFSDLLDSSIWKRRKQGFGVPLHSWFRGELGDRLIELAHAETDCPVEAKEVEDLLSAHRQQGRDYGYRLWIIYSYLLWRNKSMH